MNILFYTSFKVSATKGGTERTTISVATGLTRYYGYQCYSLYGAEDDTPKESCFKGEMCWGKKDGIRKLTAYIVDNNIDWIIIQGTFHYVSLFKKAAMGTKCKVAFAHHFEPGWEENFTLLSDFIEEYKASSTWGNRLKKAVKVCLFPLIRYKYLRALPADYRKAYQQADRIILLTKGFIPQYVEYGHLDDADKFQIVPKALSYNEYISDEAFAKKQQVALIVSRLDDPQKRISLALKIWKQVKQHPEASSWTLKIVGHGRDEGMYLQMIAQDNIPDVQMLGRQQPKPYYEEASVFLMTSMSEGCGLTITEAQQFGVVPIAFDSYAALRDIITDEEDGVVVTEGDVDGYVEKLVHLMADAAYREKLAKRGIVTCQRFSQREIAKRWQIILPPVAQKSRIWDYMSAVDCLLSNRVESVSMRYLFDCSFIQPKIIYKSIPTYAIRLIRSLPEDAASDSAVLVRPSMVSYFKSLNPSLKLVPVRSIKYIGKFDIGRKINDWLYYRSIRCVNYASILIMDEYRECTLFNTPQRKVSVIHDLKGLKEEDLQTDARYSFYDRQIASSDAVIAISRYTKGDIHRFFQVPDEKVRVVYNSVVLSEKSRKPVSIPVDMHYVLYVNTLQPYKNAITLVKAFDGLRDIYEGDLVFVGKSTDYWEKVVMPYAKDKGFVDRVIRLQDISNEELKYLYEHADLFVTTSLHEGFGYTPIEAAMCGCPVISSTCEALPDTTQGLLNYYEPAMDERALGNRITKVLFRQPSEEKLLHICETFNSIYKPEGQSLSILQVMNNNGAL